MVTLGTPAAVLPLGVGGEPLQDVIATAQERREPAQAVPVTLTIFGRQEFASSGVKDLLQLADDVPGMVFSRAPDDGQALSFRGIGTPARSQTFDQSIAV